MNMTRFILIILIMFGMAVLGMFCMKIFSDHMWEKHEAEYKIELQQVHEAGEEAFGLDVSAEANPYKKGSREAVNWYEGWVEAKKES